MPSIAEIVARIPDRSLRIVMEQLLSGGIQSNMLAEDYETTAEAAAAAAVAAADLAAHVADADPHVGYQKESEKNQLSGYMGQSSSFTSNWLTKYGATLADGLQPGANFSTSPTANTIPQALGTGKLDSSWLVTALSTWAAITRASGFDTFTATPTGANLASLLTTALPASKGGTGLTALAANVVSLLGAADYAAMRSLLGSTTVGDAVFIAASAADGRSALGISDYALFKFAGIVFSNGTINRVLNTASYTLDSLADNLYTLCYDLSVYGYANGWSFAGSKSYAYDCTSFATNTLYQMFAAVAYELNGAGSYTIPSTYGIDAKRHTYQMDCDSYTLNQLCYVATALFTFLGV